jgi:fructosamine-3-kinase
MFPAGLRTDIETLLGSPLEEARPVSGGDIHHAMQLRTEDKRDFFVKFNNHAQAREMFRTEALGLTLLGASQTIAVPKIVKQGSSDDDWSFLLMEYIKPGYKNPLFWERFGLALANLHGNTSEFFGFSHDNFIGSLPQSNTRHARWSDFYAEERLQAQFRLARNAGKMETRDGHLLDSICRKIDQICPEEIPALIHGDLWGGNFICDSAGQPVLIDPAACFAHREMDLAMTRLFSGFDRVFYKTYFEYWPLEPGFEQRMELYQLYYLLVHVNLFGGSYIDQVRRILKRFG